MAIVVDRGPAWPLCDECVEDSEVRERIYVYAAVQAHGLTLEEAGEIPLPEEG